MEAGRLQDGPSGRARVVVGGAVIAHEGIVYSSDHSPHV